MSNPNIKASELKLGDVFKTTPMVHKQHWVQHISYGETTVTVTTWEAAKIEFDNDKNIFLVSRSKEVSNE